MEVVVVVVVVLEMKASVMARLRRLCLSTQVTGLGSRSTMDARQVYQRPNKSHTLLLLLLLLLASSPAACCL